MINNDELPLRAEEYANCRGIRILRQDFLGHGSDGAVWSTDKQSAVKAVERSQSYAVELESYRRLKRAGITKIGKFNVPILEGCDDRLQIIEMSIVQPPYLLDFGKVYLDTPPQYWNDPQFHANRHEDGRENFGNQKWKEVLSALSNLIRYGIYNVDPRPANFCFGDEDSEPL
jgi:hypothetical protein